MDIEAYGEHAVAIWTEQYWTRFWGCQYELQSDCSSPRIEFDFLCWEGQNTDVIWHEPQKNSCPPCLGRLLRVSCVDLFCLVFYDFLYCDKKLDSYCITGIYLVIHTVDYGNWKSIGETCFEIWVWTNKWKTIILHLHSKHCTIYTPSVL
jgi:hypothetical protein